MAEVIRADRVDHGELDPVPVAGNILVVMLDDIGIEVLSAYGLGLDPAPTPHIDRLAAQGMKLTNHHQCQNCTPTRAALMSGQHPARTGVYSVGKTHRSNWNMRPLRPVENVPHLPLDRHTIADQLRAAQRL